MPELDREMLADEGRAVDGRDCPVDGCGGVLVHQDSINIMCEEGCGECWSLVVTDDAWELHNTEAECEHELPILETDGGREQTAIPHGPFHYGSPEGFEAWGYRFPSGFIILEWIPESVPESDDKIHGGHQSVYHSYDEFRTICTGDIEWGRSPLDAEKVPQ